MKKFILLNLFSHIAKDSIVFHSASNEVLLHLGCFIYFQNKHKKDNNKNIYLDGERGNMVKRRKRKQEQTGHFRLNIIQLCYLIMLNSIIDYILNVFNYN